jgi:hypothetical protein
MYRHPRGRLEALLHKLTGHTNRRTIRTTYARLSVGERDDLISAQFHKQPYRVPRRIPPLATINDHLTRPASVALPCSQTVSALISRVTNPPVLPLCMFASAATCGHSWNQPGRPFSIDKNGAPTSRQSAEEFVLHDPAYVPLSPKKACHIEHIGALNVDGD